MLKISQIAPANSAVTLLLEGRVVGPWVIELSDACEKILVAGCALTLNMAEVEFADHDGVASLLKFRKRGVALADCSPFLQEQLKAPE